MLINNKKRMLSGIQPTGVFTLGNYIGAIKNWTKIQDEYECLYFIANLHSLTIRKDPQELKKATLNSVALLLACGIDPKLSKIFIQSEIAEHSQLCWVLQCYTQYGELLRMTQFKDKSSKNPENINAGLFGYPSLMAADILLYCPSYVPIGADQKQHLELARDISNRFNSIYGDTFRVPEPFIPKQGARIMSLADPTNKMSKSDPNLNSFVSILDDESTINKKFKRAVTDSNANISFANGSEGVKNLITIYASIKNISCLNAENDFKGLGYGDFKLKVAQTVADEFKPIRERYSMYINDKEELLKIFQEGAKSASYIAQKTLNKVYKKLGIIYN